MEKESFTPQEDYYLDRLKNHIKNQKFKSDELIKILELLDSQFFITHFHEEKKEKNFYEYVGSKDWEMTNHALEYKKVRLVQLIVNL